MLSKLRQMEHEGVEPSSWSFPVGFDSNRNLLCPYILFLMGVDSYLQGGKALRHAGER